MKNIISLTPSLKPTGDPDHTGTHVMRTRDGRVVSSHFVAGTVNMTMARFERFGYRVMWTWPNGCAILELDR